MLTNRPECDTLSVEVETMEIRKATQADYIHIVRAIQNKGISYITPSHVRADVTEGRQFVMVNNGKVIAILSLVWDAQYQYYAMKRLCVTNKRNNGKGYAQEMIRFVSACADGKVGCTPWADNGAMRHTLEKLGFQLEYIFEKKWCFYSKKC